MRDILRQSNADLLREIDHLGETLQTVAASTPPELDIYHTWATAACDSFRQRALQHVRDLDLEQGSIIPDLLSSTQELTRGFQLFNQRLASPVVRVRPSDQLCLRLLRWLHTAHSRTQGIPVGLSDGEFGIWPVPELPTVYFMPSSAQHGLLYLPLFFHEYGHLLYACHKHEMDDLVRALQAEIADLVLPHVQRDDLQSQVEAERRAAIIETWYGWTQELFCDAVGYAIVGGAFANALSMYLRMRGRGEYQLPPQELRHRGHPVTWIRAQVLADRARGMGHAVDADLVERTWGTIATVLGVAEDYYGFYAPEFLSPLQVTIDNMLTEVAPRSFSVLEASAPEAEPAIPSPIYWLNRAWREFLRDAESYPLWETDAIPKLLDATVASTTS